MKSSNSCKVTKTRDLEMNKLKTWNTALGAALVCMLAIAGCGDSSGTHTPIGENNGNPICTAGATKCDGDTVLECSADGTAWTKVDDCAGQDTCQGGACVLKFAITRVTASPDKVVEGQTTEITITTTYTVAPDSDQIIQKRGPRGVVGTQEQVDGVERSVTVDVSDVSVAADSEMEFDVEATAGDESAASSVVVPVVTEDMEPVLGERRQIGGSSTAVALVDQDGTEWALFNKGNQLQASPVDASMEAPKVVRMPAYIHNIEPVALGDKEYAIVAMGTDGIGVVDVTDPTNMQIVVDSVGVNYNEPAIKFAEGGGSIVEEDLSGTRGDIRDVATDGTSLWIADASYGLHRTALTNLISETGPVLEDDGTLKIDADAYVMQFAGEHAWGCPVDLDLHNGKLFVAQQYLGLGIYDPQSLEKVGYYNLYTDTSVDEDWFIDMDVRTRVQSDPNTGELFLDPKTGMPDYRQANFEITQVWKNDVDAPTPFAEFDRYGKFYYEARAVDVADFGDHSIAYVAYGLGGWSRWT